MNKDHLNGRRFKVIPAYIRGEPETIFDNLKSKLSQSASALKMVRGLKGIRWNPVDNQLERPTVTGRIARKALTKAPKRCP